MAGEGSAPFAGDLVGTDGPSDEAEQEAAELYRWWADRGRFPAEVDAQPDVVPLLRLRRVIVES